MHSIIVTVESNTLNDGEEMTVADEVRSHLEYLNIPASVADHQGEPVNVSELRADIETWSNENPRVATAMMFAPKGADVMRLFTKHHEELLTILVKHKLMPPRLSASDLAGNAGQLVGVDPRD